MIKRLPFGRSPWVVALLMVAGAAFTPSALASCTFSGGSGEGNIVTFPLPPLIVLEPDTPVGSVVYEGSMESGDITQTCDDAWVQVRKGYYDLTDADAREDVLPGTYKTNVPGIGIRVATSSSQFPQYREEDLVRPMQFVGSIKSFSTTYNYRAIAQLVVIDTIEDGDLNTTALASLEAYDSDVIGEIRFSPTSVRISTNTCNLVDKNIYVPLKTINAQDFEGQYSGILTDARFKINITDCSAGTKIDYQFTSRGSTGVTDGTILNIARADAAASGVGIQILDKNNTVISFDREYTAVTSTGAKEAVEIPLKARYIKTGEVRAGKVDSVATFDVFYR